MIRQHLHQAATGHVGGRDRTKLVHGMVRQLEIVRAVSTGNSISGVASSSPTGPQSHVQNTAATSRAKLDIPVLAP